MGDKKSSVAIAEEYAKADPIYVAKTAVMTPPVVSAPGTDCPPTAFTSDLLALSPDRR